jgi:LmbE family N-acetylglucosaminyl deacetylase
MNFSLSRKPRPERVDADVDCAAAAIVGAGGTLLAVWARPEDEAIHAYGLIAACERAGVRVVRAFATGQSHTARSVTMFPRHGDGLADVSKADGARAVRRLIEACRPTAVLSFGADGVTGDPARRAVAVWVARALTAADPDGRIAHVVTDVGARWPEELVRRMHIADVFWPGFPVRRPAGPGCDVQLDDDEVEAKLGEALESNHVVKLGGALGADGLRRLTAVEAYSAVNDAARARLEAAGDPALAAA